MIAYAFVSAGLWVAICPREGCNSAEHYGPHPISGYVGGLTDTDFTCSHCGQTASAVWPAIRADIERVLGYRPVPDTRNWNVGESLADLRVENILHGIEGT